MKWQPIDTAPKCGKEILLYIQKQVTQGRWYDYGTTRGFNIVSFPYHGCGCCGGDDPTPTHWMPLPPPPKE